MAEPEEHTEGRPQSSTSEDFVPTIQEEDQPKAPEGSGRRASLTYGLKESGQKVVTAVGALFKDSRGERIDPEDDPESIRSRPTWEDDLKQYLPETNDYQPSWTPNNSSGAGPSAPGSSNAASTSSRPPMVPTLGSGNATMDLLLGIKKVPQSLAAYRWHKAYHFVKRQNAMKKKAMSSPLGTGARLHGHSFGIVPVSDDTRQAIFNFWYQSYPQTKF